jgi:hypothetical protein
VGIANRILWGFVILAIVTAVQIMATGFSSGSAYGLGGPDTSANEILGSTIRALVNIPFALLQVAAWVTLGFAAIEFAVARGYAAWPAVDKFTGDWPPSKLPPVERKAQQGTKLRSRSQVIGEIVLGIMLLIWLPLIPRHPILLLGPAADQLDLSRFAFAPACKAFYWAMIALNVPQVIWNIVDLARGTWQRSQLGKHLLFKIFGFIPLLFLITAPDHILLILRDQGANAAKYGQTVNAINHWSHVGLTVAFAMSICQIVWDAAQWWLLAYRSRAATAR